MAERVLVTGGLGYIGSVLCEHLLREGHTVTALDSLMYGMGQQGLFHLCAHPSFDFIRGDVRDEQVMREAVHRPPMSSSTSPPSSVPPPANATRSWPPASTSTRPAAWPGCAARSSSSFTRTPTAATA